MTGVNITIVVVKERSNEEEGVLYYRGFPSFVLEIEATSLN